MFGLQRMQSCRVVWNQFATPSECSFSGLEIKTVICTDKWRGGIVWLCAVVSPQGYAPYFALVVLGALVKNGPRWRVSDGPRKRIEYVVYNPVARPSTHVFPMTIAPHLDILEIDENVFIQRHPMSEIMQWRCFFLNSYLFPFRFTVRCTIAS